MGGLARGTLLDLHTVGVLPKHGLGGVERPLVAARDQLHLGRIDRSQQTPGDAVHRVVHGHHFVHRQQGLESALEDGFAGGRDHPVVTMGRCRVQRREREHVAVDAVNRAGGAGLQGERIKHVDAEPMKTVGECGRHLIRPCLRIDRVDGRIAQVGFAIVDLHHHLVQRYTLTGDACRQGSAQGAGQHRPVLIGGLPIDDDDPGRVDRIVIVGQWRATGHIALVEVGDGGNDGCDSLCLRVQRQFQGRGNTRDISRRINLRHGDAAVIPQAGCVGWEIGL